ncbi:hypothetical protein C1H76_9136 [Elsinoe australis]|uniref:Uncharacterized protein n=1 Tax=Elsinoe australis TaxID=40998 RepID=A0A4U7AK84_9PEZI|nr:hypothetical protein C1H76_9136 [Elsinoe australis]
MDITLDADLKTISIIILEYTLYFALLQIGRSQGRRGHRIWILATAILLHLAQRRTIYDVTGCPSFIFNDILITGFPSNEACITNDESYWPSTALSPPPSIPSYPINITNAILLHNAIVDSALAALPHARPLLQKSYFTLHDFSPSNPPTTSSSHASANQLRSPPYPTDLSPDPDNDDWMWYDEFPDSVLLYASGAMESDDQGLVYDQRTNLVRLFPWRDGGERPGEAYWAPLEEVLGLLLREVQEGRAVVGEEAVEKAGPQGSEERARDLWFEEVWRRKEWIASDVDRAVGMWEAYLALVGMKMGRFGGGEGFMVDKEVVEELEGGSWARALLPRLKRPGFEFVAPGLKMMSAEMVARTLDHDRRRRRVKENEWEMEKDPVSLLFYSDVRVSNLSYTERDKRWVAPYYIKNTVLDDRCGIYLIIGNEDRMFSVLPHTTDEDTFVGFGQFWGVTHAKLLNETEERLYDATHGLQDFRFHHMIARWADLVLSGDWTVGPDGVLGSLKHAWEKIPGRI